MGRATTVRDLRFQEFADAHPRSDLIHGPEFPRSPAAAAGGRKADVARTGTDAVPLRLGADGADDLQRLSGTAPSGSLPQYERGDRSRGIAWSLQHSFMPLTFDAKFMVFRLLSPVPFSVFATLLYLRLRRLVPLAIAHALLDGECADRRASSVGRARGAFATACVATQRRVDRYCL